MGFEAESVVRWEHRPQLRQPILIAAFEGWADAGDAASLAARYLSESWPVKRFATIDPEEFFDFTANRPQIRFADDGATRQIAWPETLLLAGPIPRTGRDVVILRGIEPQLRWRTYCASLLGVARALGAQMVLTLGALLADVPHTRPVPIAKAAYEPTLATRFGIPLSRYEGETGIVGVLHDACIDAGIPSVGLWASVPHYVHQISSPKAALALVEQTAMMIGTRLDPVELRAAGEVYVRTVTERVADDEDAAAYVAQLEEASDRLSTESPAADVVLPSADSLAAEAERYLRDHGRD
ncbi:MAG TPA: PAC2 family protein [Acidimicrobiales bacterium]|jgi:predicted ATP-grasp superfamily ATP-dependent carboligase|nr:PAC2 family protein [Acidimicrobiales bacterium]